jgi:hypothetical protein
VVVLCTTLEKGDKPDEVFIYLISPFSPLALSIKVQSFVAAAANG